MKRYGFDIIPLDDKVASKAVLLRREQKIKLPDAIIWASADLLGAILVTRNTKDFPYGHPSVRIPYAL